MEPSAVKTPFALEKPTIFKPVPSAINRSPDVKTKVIFASEKEETQSTPLTDKLFLSSMIIECLLSCIVYAMRTKQPILLIFKLF